MEARIKSFNLVLFERDQRVAFSFPATVVASFANRLINELPELSEARGTAGELWYTLNGIERSDTPLERSPLPEGPTSMYSKRYRPKDEQAPRVSLHPDADYVGFEITFFDGREQIYQGQYTVDDLFLYNAIFLVKNGKMEVDPEKGIYYDVVPSVDAIREVSAEVLPADAYEVEGVFRLPPRVKEESRIHFKPVPLPPLVELEPSMVGDVEQLGNGQPQAGRVFLPRQYLTDLQRQMEFSDKREEGGYVLGKCYRMPGSPEAEDDPEFRWWIKVTHLMRAERTVSNTTRLLFTGDTWSRVSRRRRNKDLADSSLVGWFHTHLFPASDDFGLSGLDQNLHSWYLPKPWQVALLVNLEKAGERTVRCYQRGPDNDLVETPFEVF